MFLRVVELVFLAAAIIGIVTQLLIPAIWGTQSFPIFRREKKLVDQITELKQKQREEQLETILREAQPAPETPKETPKETV